MRRVLIAALATLVLAGLGIRTHIAAAQELEPRSYVNSPGGLNFLLGSYGYTDDNVVFRAAAPVTDAEVQTHAGIAAYIRSLDIAGLSARLGVIVPYAAASGSAKLAGQPREREVSGFADPRFRFSLNLYGAPALTLKDLASYEQDFIVGASLDVSVPLGQYDFSKLLNIGTNRWPIKPEQGELFGSTGLYSRTGSDFDALGVAWQVRWGGGL